MIVGGGPTGVEVAGAIADMVNVTVPAVYRGLDASAAQMHILDYGDALLKPFSDKAHAYAAKVLGEKGVQTTWARHVKEVGTGHAVFFRRHHDRDPLCGLGRWHHGCRGRGGSRPRPGARRRVDVQPDLTLAGHDGVYVIGDIANIPDKDDTTLPQLGSVALQRGSWAAKNILAEFEGKPREPFAYRDKGIKAMIGRGAAIGEVGRHDHEIHGELGHMAGLGVHAALMTGTKSKIEAFVDWAWDGFSKTGGPHVLDRGDAAQIDWDDDAIPAGTTASAS